MRGKDIYIIATWATSRITPAYAGKSTITYRSLSSCTDHPRLCGEKFRKGSIGHSFQGSPPPMRGKVE